MLGDADSWEELDAKASIIVGSPETVREKLWNLIEQGQIGTIPDSVSFRQHEAGAGPKEYETLRRKGCAGTAKGLRGTVRPDVSRD